ncbi:homoserine O-acetyltransferase MetX [Rubrivirga marina]|uniref:homoserine O-acetyltransferase MetX n=1 Tax=Rubrivirga marina TaxID=1196024 RepID=UPI000BA99919|nr:homoserine O-acetyltransferase [Rubrivirga marina]
MPSAGRVSAPPAAGELRSVRLGPFTTEAGVRLPDVTVAFRTWGALDAAASNAAVVCHALTGDSDAAAWWPGLVGSGRLVDPERQFVVCANALGSCYGTTGPGTLDADGRRFGSRFPSVTIRDQARLHARLLNHLGVREVALAVGASMGGMQALELALVDREAGPDRVRRLVLVGMGAQHGAWQIGISEAQRMAIRADPRWQGGDFPADSPPEAGLAAARAMAMTTYRSAELYAERFGRTPHEPRFEPTDPRFAVESYLRYQGAKLAGRFDAGAYVRLTEAMDTHDVGRGGQRVDAATALGRLRADALCVGISSDVLYPPAETRALADLVPAGRYAELDSPFGHDAFLVDFDALDALVRPFLADTGFLAA